MHSKKTVITITQVLMALMLCVSYFIVAAPQKASASGSFVNPGEVTWSTPPAHGHPFDPSAGTPFLTMGYSQNEVFMSGTANVYENTSNTGFGIHVRTASIPYTTRVLIRYPSNPASFSGNVIVEMLNPSGTFDLATGWACFWNQLIHDNDIWVGVTCRYVVVVNPLPTGNTGLKTFDSVRYAPINFSGHERELCWDMFAQLGYALKHNHNLPPALSGYNITHLIGHGYSQTGAFMITWINFFDQYFCPDLYDAYNPMAAGGPAWMNDDDINNPVILARDGLIPFGGNPATDPRRIIQPCGKPVVHINTESEVNAGNTGFLSPVLTRRPDANTSSDRFVHYEIPGSCHINAEGFAVYPDAGDIAASLGGFGLSWCCIESQTSFSDFHQEYPFHAAYSNLKAWMLNHATPPPSEASPITVNGGGVIQRDANGNALGGLRTPWVDFPTNTYRPAMTPCPSCGIVCAAFSAFCFLQGTGTPIRCAYLVFLYTSNADYHIKFNSETDNLTVARWFNAWENVTIKATAPNISGCAFPSGSGGGAPSASINTAGGVVSFSINGGGITGLTNIPATSLPCSAGGFIFPFGMFSYNIVGLPAGGTSFVTIHTTTPMPMGSKVFKCLNGSLVDFTQYVQQPDPNTFILTLKDGGQGDSDGQANGTIVDPCGPAFMDTSPHQSSAPQVPTVAQGPAPIANIAVQS
ncbi:MAG: alpha/beta hydrolase domain-containing protein, partial [Dehalococcoidia bacterium]